ncbi:MAG: diguanylate cyclase [Chloroflexota bacterium]|jgi:diguanylate cyclase (GGDEF)-like protein/PAS domain S-box-containing protein
MKKINHLQNDTLSSLRSVIIFSLDIKYQYTAFTESHREVMKRIWGAEIAIGQNMLEYIHREDDRKKAQENFDKVLRGESLIMEEEYGDESGHIRSWWEDRYVPVYDEKGEIVGISVFVIDITQRKQIEQALRTSEINYRSIMDQAADGIFIAEPSGRYVDVNRAGCEMLGYTREEILSLSMQDLAAGTKYNPIRMKDLLEGKTVIAERDLIGKNGKLVPVEISAKMMRDGRLIGIARNVVDRRREEARVRFLAFVMDKVSSAVISTDNDLKINYWNKGAEILYGWQEADVLGKLVDDVCGTEFMEGQQELAQQSLIKDKTWRGELKQKHRSGKEIWVDASVTLLEDDSGNYVGGVTINHDVTERKLAEDELRRTKESIEQINLTLRRAFEREQLASRTDSLTGVFNRRYFFELLGYEFSASRRYERPLSLVMFDVDYLKKINDTYGHQVGDELLKKAANVVRGELRTSDVLARYGGDEFVILLSNSSEQDASMVLERIYRELKSTIISADHKKLGISISAGISSLQPDMEKADQLVMLADRALYVAKNSGRNRVVIFNNDEGEK